MKDDPFDPENLRLQYGTRASQKETRSTVVVPAKLKKRREQFALVPMSLWEKLNDARGQTLRLIVYLIHMYWQGDYKPVKLANEIMEVNGVCREAKRRALHDLESRGVVIVDQRRRKSPIVRFAPPWDTLLRR
jgi:hypothetical protein